MNKAEYKQTYNEFEQERSRVARDNWRLSYHIMPDSGWLNDPNGLCQFHGVYHIYYQYSPFDVEGKQKLWGHMTSLDLCTWKQGEPVLYPDSAWDMHGVYSGSAFFHDEKITFFYTGNVKYVMHEEYDYINSGREQNTITVSSHDGFHFDNKELVLSNKDYPSDMSCHVRDPKIYEKNNVFYMVLGARDIHAKGCVLVYKSEDLTSWTYCNRLQTPYEFGYMWECPDFFELDSQQVLLTCPQGVKPQGYDYANVHQCGCFLIEGDIEGPNILQHFQQIDRGFDFYAPQTFLDEKGRRILIGWMGLPDIPYTNPTCDKGWQHALSIPRVLHVRNKKLIQQPIEELQMLRKQKQNFNTFTLSQANMRTRVYELQVEVVEEASFVLHLRNTSTLQYQQGVLTLSLNEEGYGRKERSVKLKSLRNLWIYSDTSSLEIFVNDGEEVFTNRVYEQNANKELSFNDCKMIANVVFYELDGYTFL